MIAASELILNPDGSVYHLKLLPEKIADIIITVGDPERVKDVSKHFERIDFKASNREFITHTGELKGKRITVLSTGIGTDNIDIVLNELDALANIDLKLRAVKTEHKALNIIRIGTSGSLHADIPCDSFVLSEYSLGMDGLMPFYDYEKDEECEILLQDIDKQINIKEWQPIPSYLMPSGKKLFSHFFDENHFKKGITATCTGFYAPQGRQLRAKAKAPFILDKLASYKNKNGFKITNFEMETAGIYALSHVLGHKALSCNAILANRVLGTFSQNPIKAVNNLIELTLEKISSL